MDRIAAECKAQRHHPEWSNMHNKVFIRWTTHSPPGLSEKDIHMAEFCNSVTERVTKLPSEEKIRMGREMADAVAQIGKGCCVPSWARTKS
jgi:4a-hydroxytetrahydrobiopterin dehydratase